MLLILLFHSFGLSADLPIDVDLGGPISTYTSWISEYSKTWPETKTQRVYKDQIQIECIETPGQPFHIGVLQWMLISAPLSEMEAVLDKVGRFQELFPGFVEISVVDRKGNSYRVKWEKDIPLFFIPNVTYETIYVTQRQNGRKTYRYKLHKATSTMRSADGIIMLEEVDGKTRFTEVDFWDSDYGIVETLFPSRIWNDSIEGILLADLAVKILAENPKLPSDRIRRQARELQEKFDISACVSHKKSLKILNLLTK